MKSSSIILLLIWPSYLNDFYLIALGNERLGLLWSLDVIKILIEITILVYLFRHGHISLPTFGLKSRPAVTQIMAGVLLCGVLVILFRWNIGPWLRSILPWKLYAGYDFL